MELIGLAIAVVWLLFFWNKSLDTFWEDNGEPLDGFEPYEHDNEGPDNL